MPQARVSLLKDCSPSSVPGVHTSFRVSGLLPKAALETRRRAQGAGQWDFGPVRRNSMEPMHLVFSTRLARTQNWAQQTVSHCPYRNGCILLFLHIHIHICHIHLHISIYRWSCMTFMCSGSDKEQLRNFCLETLISIPRSRLRIRSGAINRVEVPCNCKGPGYRRACFSPLATQMVCCGRLSERGPRAGGWWVWRVLAGSRIQRAVCCEWEILHRRHRIS